MERDTVTSAACRLCVYECESLWHPVLSCIFMQYSRVRGAHFAVAPGSGFLTSQSPERSCQDRPDPFVLHILRPSGSPALECQWIYLALVLALPNRTGPLGMELGLERRVNHITAKRTVLILLVPSTFIC